MYSLKINLYCGFLLRNKKNFFNFHVFHSKHLLNFFISNFSAYIILGVYFKEF